MQIKDKNYLHVLINEIANTGKLLNDYNMCCKHKSHELKILIVKYHGWWVLLIDLRAIMKNSLKLRRVLKKKLEAFLQMVKYTCNALFLTSEIEALKRNLKNITIFYLWYDLIINIHTTITYHYILRLIRYNIRGIWQALQYTSKRNSRQNDICCIC